jgi:hypothetical protein
VGQSLVVDPATETLTPAAEAIVKRPGFISELIVDAGVDGGAAESAAAVSVWEGAGVLPVLGAAGAAFGAGLGIGTWICNNVLSGLFGNDCLGDETETADAPVVVPEWVMATSVLGPLPEGGVIYPYEYYLKGANTPGKFVKPGGPCSKGSGAGGQSRMIAYEYVAGACLVEGVPTGSDSVAYVRDATANRVFSSGTVAEAGSSGTLYSGSDYCALNAAGTAVGGCAKGPPASWPAKFATALGAAGLAPEAVREKVGQHIAHAIDPSIGDPYGVSSPVPPACRVGAKAGPCLSALEELEVVPKVKELDWEEAVVEELDELEPEKTREEESERIIELPDPLPAEVTKGTEFDVTVNPDKEHMPEYIPEPGEGETEEEYKERKVPWIPLPFWHSQTLDDATLDPSKGPEEITELNPRPGTRVDPSGETDVHAKVNPADAPVPGGGTAGQGSCNASVGAVDWSPLNRPLGSKFPFGVFGFFTGWMSSWEGESSGPPNWNVTILPAGAFGSPHGLHAHVALGFLQPVIAVVRIVFLFAAFVGLLWFLATAAAKLQGDSS